MRVLFVADTHLGFDLPFKPRVDRRRRGPDFFANFERALGSALRGEVDVVVHGGDLLYRSRVPPKLVSMAMAPLQRVADTGIPVFLVPGNHERSRIPLSLLTTHPLIHVFHRPRTVTVRAQGLDVAFAGFPYVRKGVRQSFCRAVDETGTHRAKADIKVFCMHHCVEGARVGPGDYMFRSGDDVVRAMNLPQGHAAVLSGHIHRSQVLTHDLRGRRVPCPVVYPGSTERTSFAETDETKGYMLLDLAADGVPGGHLAGWRFCALPVRPMITAELSVHGAGREALESQVVAAIRRAPADAVLRFRLHGALTGDAADVMGAANLRSLAPPTMNVTVAFQPGG